LPFGGGVDALTTEDLNEENADISDFQVYDKHDNMLHGPKEKGKRMVSMQFMRKYIQFAKSISPQLTEESRNLISEEYVKLRAEDVYNKDTQTARTQPVTVRTLETLIRLSTAHARARLSKNIEAQDAEAAIQLIEYAFFKKVLTRKKAARDDYDMDSGNESGGGGEEVTETTSGTTARTAAKKRSRVTDTGVEEQTTETNVDELTGTSDVNATHSDAKAAAKRARKGTVGETDPFDVDDDAAGPALPGVVKGKGQKTAGKKDSSQQGEASGATPTIPAAVFDEERYNKFKKALNSVFVGKRVQEISSDELERNVKEAETAAGFERPEVVLFLDKMQEANQVMVSDNMVYLI